MLGFKVIDVPRFGTRPDRDLPVAGHLLCLLIDNKFFAPVFGLGQSEESLLAEVQDQLPEPAQLIPIPAQHMLLNNGGVHCTIGIVRKLDKR